MSIFTSFVTEVLEVPGEPGQTITIRRLQPNALTRALDAGKERNSLEMERGARDMRMLRESMGDAEFDAFKAEIAKNIASGPAKSNPLSAFDRVSLIKDGVTAWTFDRALGIEAFEDLDDDTQDWLAGAILKLSKPSLYAANAEAAQKEA